MLKKVSFLHISPEVGLRISKLNIFTRIFIAALGWKIVERDLDDSDESQQYSLTIDRSLSVANGKTERILFTRQNIGAGNEVENDRLEKIRDIVVRTEENFASSPVFGVCVLNLTDWEAIKGNLILYGAIDAKQ